MLRVSILFVCVICSIQANPSEELSSDPVPFNVTNAVEFIIDDFSLGTHQNVGMNLDQSGYTPKNQSNFYSPGCTDVLLGCSRSMIMKLFTLNYEGPIIASILRENQFFRVPGSCYINPGHSENSVTLQYDSDQDPSYLNVTGLGGIDFTAQGRAVGILFSSHS